MVKRVLRMQACITRKITQAQTLRVRAGRPLQRASPAKRNGRPCLRRYALRAKWKSF